MPRPDKKAPKTGQDELFPISETPSSRLSRRHSTAMSRALEVATERGILTEVDQGLATLAMAGAWSLDEFERTNQPYGPGKLLEPLREVLESAQMTPGSRASNLDDKIEEMLNELDATEIPHTEESEPSDTGA